ncbi:MAG: transposase [Bacilli bacterium]
MCDVYGYRRIVEGLNLKYGVIMNGKKVLRIMKKYNLMTEYVRKSKKKNRKTYTKREKSFSLFNILLFYYNLSYFISCSLKMLP